MIAVKQAVSFMQQKIREGKPSEALTVLDTHEQKLAFKYGTLHLLAANEGNRQQARHYHRIYRRLLRRLRYEA